MNLRSLLLLLFMFSCKDVSVPIYSNDINNINYPIIAHSHNDYDQVTPVLTALELGFKSIEVDIIFDGLDIVVSHDDKNLSGKPKFEKDYFSTIIDIPNLGIQGIVLLVDIKEYSDELLDKLNSILLRHKDRLVSRDESLVVANKIKVILSGDIPRKEIIRNELNKFLFIDGRFNDEDLNSSSEIVPIISMDIAKLEKSNFLDKEVLTNIIGKVHEKEKSIRFWNTKDNESTWLTLMDLDVDIIGVDELENFHGIMKKNGFVK